MVEKQIEAIDRALEWVKTHRQEDYERKFIDLVNQRRALKTVQRAERMNPAIAAYGESQKGKSYLIGNLLKKDSSPFKVRGDGGEEEIDFVADLNPIGDKQEATGVVTRFCNKPSQYDKEHPILLKIISVTDLVLILSDGYYNDVQDSKVYLGDDIYDFVHKDIYEKYIDKPQVAGTPLTPDAVLDLKSYVSSYTQNKTTALIKGDYFEKLALVADRIPVSDYPAVFEKLWHDNPTVTKLFRRLLSVLERLGFAEEVCVSVEAARHKGVRENTVLGVWCLMQLDNANWDRSATVFVKDGQGNTVREVSILTSELSAIIAEAVFKIEDEYLDSVGQYAPYTNDDGYSLVSREVSKDLLKYTDILDFPGARPRESYFEENLGRRHEDALHTIMSDVFRRGKVAYLFNSYSTQKIINVLLLVHDYEQVNFTGFYQRIENWVDDCIGDTPEARKLIVERCDGVGPLFLVATKFNYLMRQEDGDEEKVRNILNGRWKSLFNDTFKEKLIHSEVDWFKNWVSQGTNFKNFYLLRDFKYSGCTGNGNNLYTGYNPGEEGYDPDEDEHEEKAMKLSTDFYRTMRSTFVSNRWVKEFFENPELSWDVAATMNNDGALYIIQNLGKVVKGISAVRRIQFEQKCKEACKEVRRIMQPYYRSDNPDDILKENIAKMLAVKREMSVASGVGDGCFFGRLLNAMQMTEAQALVVVHDCLQGSGTRALFDAKYELILHDCNYFSGLAEPQQMWQKFLNAYGFKDKAEGEEYLRKHDLRWESIVKAASVSRSTSFFLAKQVVDAWLSRISSSDFCRKMSDTANFDCDVMTQLTSHYKELAEDKGVANKIAQEIDEYTKGQSLANINEMLVADVAASVISDFVIDFGFSLMEQSDIDQARETCKSFAEIADFNNTMKDDDATYDNDSLNLMFERFSKGDRVLTVAFCEEYDRWLACLLVSLVSHININGYDSAANTELGKVLNDLKSFV